MTLRRSAAFLGLVARLVAGDVAAAVPGIGYRSIGWFDTLTPGSEDFWMDCPERPGEVVLVASFLVPVALTEVWGLEAAIDFCTMPHDLPDWWQFDAPGGCREGAMTVSTDFSSGPSTHEDLWQDRGVTGLTFITNHMGDADRARIAVTVAMSLSEAESLTPYQEYYAFKIIFTSPNGPCDGCDIPACFVINELRLLHGGGTTTIWSDGYSSYARWFGAQGDCPFIVPVEAQSWGSLKALHR